MRFAIAWMCWSIVLVSVAACSSSREDALTVSVSSLQFLQDWGAPVDPSAATQTVTITSHADQLLVGYTPGADQVGWLTFMLPTGASQDSSLAVTASSTSLMP